MELKLGATVSYFLWSLLLGWILAVIYDFFRSSRRIFKTSVFSINFQDIIFFVLVGGSLFAIAYLKNNGRLRFQGFLGFIAGFLVYRLIFRDFLVQFLVLVYELLAKMLRQLLNILLFPIKILYKILAKPFLVVGWYCRQGITRTGSITRTLVRKRRMKQNIYKKAAIKSTKIR